MDHNASNNYGFTIIELLIALAISGIVSTALITTFLSQQKSYVVQDNVAAMQQNLRGGMEMMAREIRLAGYNRDNVAGTMGILDICPRDINYNIDVTMNGNGAIQIAFEDLDDTDGLFSRETISFSLADLPFGTPDGNFELTRDAGKGSGRELLAENIEAMGMAFAYDADGDGNLDVSAGGNVIWAVDSDGDNDLDLNLDTNDDGDIDPADGPGAGGSGLITGSAIVPNINIDSIRAVRIWLLARTERRDPNYVNGQTYVVGHKVISPRTDGNANNDSCRMRLLTTTVKCRNLGL